MMKLSDFDHGSLNLLTNCDLLCHVIHLLCLKRRGIESGSAPPYFVDHVGDTQCRFTDLAKFHCDVVGAPKPEVSWYKDENKSPLLSEGGKYAIVFERGHVMLMISDVNSNDIGCYTCKIRNDLGEATSSGRLFINFCVEDFHQKIEKESRGTSNSYENAKSNDLEDSRNLSFEPQIIAGLNLGLDGKKTKMDAHVSSDHVSLEADQRILSLFNWIKQGEKSESIFRNKFNNETSLPGDQPTADPHPEINQLPYSSFSSASYKLNDAKLTSNLADHRPLAHTKLDIYGDNWLDDVFADVIQDFQITLKSFLSDVRHQNSPSCIGGGHLLCEDEKSTVPELETDLKIDQIFQKNRRYFPHKSFNRIVGEKMTLNENNFSKKTQEQESNFRKGFVGSILSLSSTSSLPYYSACDDSFSSDGTLEYFSPCEDFEILGRSSDSSPTWSLDDSCQMRTTDVLFANNKPLEEFKNTIETDAKSAFKITAFDTIDLEGYHNSREKSPTFNQNQVEKPLELEAIAVQTKLGPVSKLQTTSRQSAEENHQAENVRFRGLYDVMMPIRSGSRSVIKLVQSARFKTMFVAKYIKRNEEEFARKEASILKRLHHQNIVKFEDCFETPNYVVIITERCQQELFSYLLSLDEITERKISLLIKQLCSALLYLHHNRIIHLSVRPESIMLCRTTLKLINFDDSCQSKQNEPVFCDWGVPEFVAPEIITSSLATPHTDMWSVGVIASITCTGVYPFAGSTDLTTIHNIMHLQRNPSFMSPHLSDFVEKLLKKNLDERMTSWKALQHDWLNRCNDLRIPYNRVKLFHKNYEKQRLATSGNRCSIAVISSSLNTQRGKDVNENPIYTKQSKPGCDRDRALFSIDKEMIVSIQNDATRKRSQYSQSRVSGGSLERPLALRQPCPTDQRWSLQSTSFDTLPDVDHEVGLRGVVLRKNLDHVGKKVSFDDEISTSSVDCNPKQVTSDDDTMHCDVTSKQRFFTSLLMKRKPTKKRDCGVRKRKKMQGNDKQLIVTSTTTETHKMQTTAYKNTGIEVRKGILKKKISDDNLSNHKETNLFKENQGTPQQWDNRGERSTCLLGGKHSTLTTRSSPTTRLLSTTSSIRLTNKGLRGPFFERKRNNEDNTDTTTPL